MNIYDANNQLVLAVDVDDESYRYRAICGENELTLKYSLAVHVELPVGAYCDYQGQRYTLERPESFKMKHTRNFEYTVTMESYQAKAKIWKFRNPVDGRLKFPLTAKPVEHLQMFVDNMNRRDSGWTIGECVDDVEHLISYDHDYCWDALAKMASEFKTEFEISSKEVSLRKVEYNKNNPLSLSYGRGNGFKSGLGRSNSSDTPPVEILFVQGGSRNIDRSTYGNSELLLPAQQEISYDGEHFEDEQGYVSANARRYAVDNAGLSIHRADKQLSSMAEDSLDCSDSYPKRVGTISSVVVVNASKNFYDIVDESIPAALDYEDCLIAGETMTIIFQSGMLAGREFEVKYYHQALNPQKVARRFEIVPQDIDGETMPNSTFAPAVGDKYAVFKVMLPQAYIRDDSTKSGASWDMFRTAVKYLFDNEEQKFSFTGELDGIWAKQDWVNIGGKIKLGGFVLFSDDRFQQDGVLVRITGIKDYINNPHSPVIEISNNTVSSGFASQLKTLESEEVLIEENHREALQFTKRRFRDVKETMSMLEESLLENFAESISPITVNTMALLVGDESLQFQFVTSASNPIPVAWQIAYNSGTKQLTAAAGTIQHLTIDIADISINRTAADYHYWSVSAFTSAVLDDDSKKYYLYIRADKNAQKGTAGSAAFVLSETALNLSVGTYYNFLVGILNSASGGERSFVSLYGFTEILPGRITTDRIVSADGSTYFDLANGEIGGIIKFLSNGEYMTVIDGGYIKTDLINARLLEVARVLAGDADGRRIEINPENKSVYIYDSNNVLVTTFEGNSYADINALFGNSTCTVAISEAGGSEQYTPTEAQNDGLGFGTQVISQVFQTTSPCMVEFTGAVSCNVSSGANTKEPGHATATVRLYVQTFADSACTQLIQQVMVAAANCSVEGNESTTVTDSDSHTLSSADSKTVIAGYHRLLVAWEMEITNITGGGALSGVDEAYIAWSNIASTWKSEVYISRFFANGFCIGTRRDNYILAQNQANGMSLKIETNNFGLEVSPTGVRINRGNGTWANL